MNDRAFGQLFNGTMKIPVRKELMELRYGVKAIWESLDQKFKNQVDGGLSTFEKVFADYMEYDEVVKAGNPAKWLHLSDQVAALSTTNANWRVDTADRYKALSEISPLLNGGKSLNEEQYQVLERYDYAEKDKDGNYTLKPGAAASVTSYLKDNQALYELIKYERDAQNRIQGTAAWDALTERFYYKNGFVNLSREFVRFMTQVLGMEWGGTYGRAVDAMHFSYKLEKWRW
ncbi:hypothetical protein [Treponema sp. J25]|uniref:hypothetical protein n=1 Tax=Treponema sp. J25 TaxID=2094121 RepID=UPI001047BF17|nr:hypothetical protein [Treponema sp. J25]TCW60944.1 hypothetical protein C5O22_08880 [Treponema sp. J25]